MHDINFYRCSNKFFSLLRSSNIHVWIPTNVKAAKDYYLNASDSTIRWDKTLNIPPKNDEDIVG